MIYLNNKELGNLHVGEKEIQRVLLGESLIWENNKVVVLGWGKSWNIRDLYPNLYNQLTADNFFFLSANTVTGSDSVSVAYQGDTQYISIRGGLSKSYNPSTGVLSMYLYNNSNSSNVCAVMVSKPEKLIYMGLGTSFNVRSKFPNAYQSMTVDNFIVRTVSHWNNTGSSNGLICNNSRSYPGNWSGTNRETFTKSYNPNTGVLTCYLNDTGNCDNIESWNRNSNVYVYAAERSFV